MEAAQRQANEKAEMPELANKETASPPDMQERTSFSSESSTESNDNDEIENGPRENPIMESATKTSTGSPVHSIFSTKMKRYIIFMVACGGFFSPLSANIYFPAINVLGEELHATNEMILLTITSYMIFQGLAPTLMGDLADMAGRRPAYIIGFVIYLGANIGLALQDNYAALFILRCLQSTGSSGTIALGSGVVADISTASERGRYLGWATFGIMLAPAIGPILGGVLSQFLGWRAIFWFLTILAGVYMVPLIITFPETSRNVVGNGSIPARGWNMSLLGYLAFRKAEKEEASNGLGRTRSQEDWRLAQAELARKRKLRFPNPLSSLKIIREKDNAMVLFYNSLVYTAFYCITASLPTQFREIYGFNELEIGLCFL
jgi:multidrug resistance protein